MNASQHIRKRRPGRSDSRLRVLPFALLLALLVAQPVLADAESPIRFRFAGEMLYSRFDYGPDQKSGENGSPADSRAVLDIPRFVMEIKYSFEPDFYVEAELEYEHGGAGGALELEYEEFGEYEPEVEVGGEVRLEELYVAKRFHPALRIKAGRLPVPIGFSNTYGLPTDYFGTQRFESERELLPVTWTEIGAQADGTRAALSYRVALVNALDSSGFSSKNWIAGGYQQRFELVQATDLAVAALLEYEVAAGVRLGAAGYRGNTTGNRPKPDMEGVDAAVTLMQTHARVERAGLALRALFLHGTLDNADEISAKNSRLSVNLGVPRTPVAREARIAHVECGYDVLRLVMPDCGEQTLSPFVRWERFDSMYDTDAAVFDDPRFERTVLAGGFEYRPNPNVTIKTEYTRRSLGEERFRKEQTWSLGVGFHTF